MKKKILYVGMDVHKKSIDVAITDERANGQVRSYGKIDGTLEALDKLVGKLKSNASDLHAVTILKVISSCKAKMSFRSRS